MRPHPAFSQRAPHPEPYLSHPQHILGLYPSHPPTLNVFHDHQKCRNLVRWRIATNRHERGSRLAFRPLRDAMPCPGRCHDLSSLRPHNSVRSLARTDFPATSAGVKFRRTYGILVFRAKGDWLAISGHSVAFLGQESGGTRKRPRCSGLICMI